MAVAPRLVLLGVLASLLGSGAAWEAFRKPLPAHVLMPVELGPAKEGGARAKRQSEPVEMNQPLRILPMYSDSFSQDLGGKVSLIQDTIIPKVLDFVQRSFSVAPLPGPILLNNACTGPLIIRDAETGVISCPDRCAATMCGAFRVPTDHLKQCIECRNRESGGCRTGTPSEDGPGVSGYDFVLYVTADASLCPTVSEGSARTVALAVSCQSEALQDRPIAGSINFCPSDVQSQDPDFAFAVTKHEILHALGFSRFQFSMWRDPATNEPRTPRNVASGLPDVDPNSRFPVISDSTLQTITYNNWTTVNGQVDHQVTMLVTPAIRAEGRRHFNCPSLFGVELENQGGPGTAMDHWEKRLLGNEAMTGQVTFNPVFSRFTFAAFEDSGWYSVDYSVADELVWGQDAGCEFATGSCGNWIQTQTESNAPLAPFCTEQQNSNPIMLSCTADHEAVSRCNRVAFTSALDPEYQYFSSPTEGGSITLTDFCPIQDIFTIRFSDDSVQGTTCAVGENQPGTNDLLESYGGTSRCVRHGRQWTFNGNTVKYGGGCYQYSCSEDSVTIIVGSQQLECSCSEAGREIVVNQNFRGSSYEGSILCPECSRICHTPSSSIQIAATGGIDSDTSGAPSTTHSSLLLVGLSAALMLITWQLH